MQNRLNELCKILGDDSVLKTAEEWRGTCEKRSEGVKEDWDEEKRRSWGGGGGARQWKGKEISLLVQIFFPFFFFRPEPLGKAGELLMAALPLSSPFSPPPSFHPLLCPAPVWEAEESEVHSQVFLLLVMHAVCFHCSKWRDWYTQINQDDEFVCFVALYSAFRGVHVTVALGAAI